MGKRPRTTIHTPVLDRGKAAALFYGCETVQEAQRRYEELTAKIEYKNPHAKLLLSQQFQRTKLHIFEAETARLTLMGMGVPKVVDLATLVAVLGKTDPTTLAAALEQVELQKRKRDVDHSKPVPAQEPTQEPVTPDEPLSNASDHPQQEPVQKPADEWAGFEWDTPATRKVVESVEMADAGLVMSASAASNVPAGATERPQEPGFTADSIAAQAEEIIHDEMAAVTFPLDAGSRWYPQQWAFFSEAEKWENCIAFLNDIGGRGGLDRAVLARKLHEHHAAEILTLYARKKSEAGRKGHQTRTKNIAK